LADGIRGHSRQEIISGCRVAFDPRGTKAAHEKRDMRNYKAEEEGMRRRDWEARQSTRKDAR
jgi:hypothetical protein